VDESSERGEMCAMSAPSIQRLFGVRVRELRSSQGFSQEAFAARANLDRGAYGKIERGEINVGIITIARIAVALNLTLSQLLGEIDLCVNEITALPRLRRGPQALQKND
jgi:transcriptional regulator with XRE-family HTH domain